MWAIGQDGVDHDSDGRVFDDRALAQLYYEDKPKQAEISETSHVRRATVSRPSEEGRGRKASCRDDRRPRGTYPKIESALARSTILDEAIVAERFEDRGSDPLAIGAACGAYFETTISEGDVIGISSWSASLLRMVDAIHPMKRPHAERVVQILGGLGDPSVQSHATQLTTRLASLTGAEAQLLPAQGVVSSSAARLVMLGDVYARRNGSVPTYYDRARRHRSASAFHHAYQFRQRFYEGRVAGSREARRNRRHLPPILRSQR